MRLIKMIGLAAVAAMVATAFVGATSASANGSTALCTVKDGLTCDSGTLATTVGMLGSGELLSDLIDVLCLHVHGTGTVLNLANPQQVHVNLLDFLGCGTKSAHNNCTVSVLELPLANLLKTGLDHGVLEGTNGLTLIICDNIDIFGIDIHCTYDATGLQFLVGNQLLHADDTAVEKAEDLSLCPEESFLDGLLSTTANRYVLA